MLSLHRYYDFELVYELEWRGESMQILLVYDDLYTAKQIERYIVACYDNCKVMLCVNANQFQKIVEFQSKEVDLCFTKVKLQGISGIQVVQEMRRHNPKMKIVFFSDTDEYALDAWKLGVNDYLLEPITVESIQHSMKSCE